MEKHLTKTPLLNGHGVLASDKKKATRKNITPADFLNGQTLYGASSFFSYPLFVLRIIKLF